MPAPKKQYVFTILLIWVGFGCNAQERKELDFKQTVLAVEQGFSSMDSMAVLKFINNDIGLYQIDRVGAFDHYNHFKNVSFKNRHYPQVLLRNAQGLKILKPRFEKLPVWDCAREVWSKIGCFVDTIRTNHLLTSICYNNNRYQGDKISNKTIKAFYELENRSRRVVVFDKKGKALVFYLSFIGGNWYLTILDYASADCSV